MQFSQTYHDPVAPLSQQGLGYWAAAAMMAAEAYQDSQEDDGGTDTSASGTTEMPGGEPSAPRQPGAITTISPAIQTTISPQISPTMVQQQDSPGASVGASPMQYMPGGQQADTGTTSYGGWGDPSSPGVSPVSPLQPYGRDPNTGYAFPYGSGPGQYPYPDVYQAEPSPWAGLAAMPWTPLVLVGGGLAALWMFTRRPKR